MNARMPGGDFPGYRRPALDFLSVRDQLRAQPFSRELDLSAARSIAAGTQEVVELAGNSFYVDPIIDAAGNSIGGVAVARFEDTRLSAPSTPFTIRDNFNARIPFTRILIENPAQPGKRLRIIYGVDVDFVPGFSASVSIAGTVGVTELGLSYGAAYISNTNLAALGNENIFTAGANVAGARVVEAGIITSGNATNNLAVLLSKATAPATLIDGHALLQASTLSAGNYSPSNLLQVPKVVPAGRGLFAIAQLLENGVHRFCNYTL